MNIDVLRGGSFTTDPIEGPGVSTQMLKIGAWWENKATVVHEIISRRELIWSMRSQDGGSHYDEKLSKAAYINVRDPDLGVKYAFTEKGTVLKRGSSKLHIIPEIPPKDSNPPIRTSDWKPIEGAHKYAVRVIGEELSLALEREGY